MINALDQTEKRDPLDILVQCKSDAWEFAKYCFTKDEADPKTPTKRFPYEKPHIKFALKMMQREKKLLFPKSRRMQMTWTACVFMLWDAMFKPGRFNPVCSKKQEDAEWLIKNRIKFIYDNLDKEFPKHLLPRLTHYKDRVEFEEIGSTIQAFPQGEHQLRQFTASTIFADEMAFWEEAEGTYAAAKPTLDGGGSFFGISSPAPGFFKRMVFDEVDQNQENHVKRQPQKEFPVPGIEVWRNPVNKFTVVQLHYSADPKKQSQEYKSEIKSGMPIARYRQEYELQWDVYEGMPVYPDFVKKIHGVEKTIDPEIGLPLLIGFDFGLTPAAIIAQLQGESFCVLKEYIEINMGARRFAKMVAEDLRTRYPFWSNLKKDFLCYVDPSGFKKAESDETSAALEVAEYFNPEPGAITFEDRRKSVEQYLVRVSKGEPCFKISIPDCPVLVRGFEGGYRYPEKNQGELKPIKDEHSHPHDALQMITSRISILVKKRTASIPAPSYHQQRTQDGRTNEKFYRPLR